MSVETLGQKLAIDIGAHDAHIPARQLRREEIVQALGGLPQASTHASHLAIDTLAAVLQQLRTGN